MAKAKAWWEVLLDLLAGLLAKQELRDAGGTPAQLDRAVTVSMPLGSGYDRQAEEDRQRAAVVAYMRSKIGTPYKLGAEVAPGQEAEAGLLDCSESVEAAFRVAGMVIPDGSPYQYDHCRPVKAPKLGDLGFLWSDKWGRIGHVMVATDAGTVLHAVGGRGLVEDPVSLWEGIPRWRGWRRHPDWARPAEDRA